MQAAAGQERLVMPRIMPQAKLIPQRFARAFPRSQMATYILVMQKVFV